MELLRLMDRLCIHCVNLGLPGAGKRAQDDVERLARFIVEEKLRILQNWDVGRLERLTREAISFVVKHRLPASFVTEDTTRSHPKTLDVLFRAAIEAGATRLVLCDTCGHATPDGVRNLLNFTRSLLRALDVEGRVELDWHGHN